MTRDDDFEVNPGRIRQGGARNGTALRQVLAARQRAGGPGRSSASGTAGRPSVFGRGRVAGVRAVHQLGGAGARAVVVKARVVRHRPGAAPLSAHLRYLQRDGVTKDGQPGRLFDADRDRTDVAGFGARCDGDRHHFRFIVAPEDGAELHNLKTFSRDLMTAMQADLGTRLDWVAVEHWNTTHPHVHILVRGVDDDGRDLVISRDYIGQGLRARACERATLELGPRSEVEIGRALARDVASDRWTRLDGQLARDAVRTEGRIDLRPDADRGAVLRAVKIARLEVLHDLGLATPEDPGRWRLNPEVEPTLKALGRRNDIIARLHQGLADGGQARPAEHLVANESPMTSVTGRVLAMGLDDELKGSGYLVIDGLDGRVHHQPVRDLAELGIQPGAVVEVASSRPHGGRDRPADTRPAPMTVFVRSDLSIEAQASAEGSTWLDRRLMRSDRAPANAGFGQAVEAALSRRVDHLESQGLARRHGDKTVFARSLLTTLRDRDLATAGRKLADETGRLHRPAVEGETVSGDYRKRVTLASGRFAMIDDGLGFTLVPWRPALERRLGQSVSGTVGPGQTIDWSQALSPVRSRGPGR